MRLVVANVVLAAIAQTKAVNSVSTFPGQFDALARASQDFLDANRGQSEDALSSVDGFPLKTLRAALLRGAVAQRIALVAALAFEQRQRSGSFPEAVPDPSVLQDPLGFTLKYVKEPDGFMVYWAGPDGVDGGGVEQRGSLSRALKGDDFGYRYGG